VERILGVSKEAIIFKMLNKKRKKESLFITNIWRYNNRKLSTEEKINKLLFLLVKKSVDLTFFKGCFTTLVVENLKVLK